MRRPQIAFISLVALIGTMLPVTHSWAQVDPEWLKSWQTALESRPNALTSQGRIASENEPGVPLIIDGQIFGPDGEVAKDIVVHAYHRDDKGFEFGSQDRPLATWRLQGWVKTDAQGRFELQTIRPAADHMGREGAHIHFTIESDDYGRQWAQKIFFADDPLVTEAQKRRSAEAGEFAWVKTAQKIDGVLRVEIKIKLKDKGDF